MLSFESGDVFFSRMHQTGADPDPLQKKTFQILNTLVAHIKKNIKYTGTAYMNQGGSADLHWFNADPDPRFFINVDLDPDPDI